MWKRVKDFLTKLENSKPVFDSSFVDDALAQSIDWSSLSPGGSNFRTRKLTQISASRVAFIPSWGMKLFIGAFSIPAIIILVVFWSINPLAEDDLGKLMFTLVPLIFIAVSGLLWYFILIPTVFDKRAGYFWKGWKNPQFQFRPPNRKKSAKLKSVYALQIIAERISSKNGSYKSYELNLVLEDASRVNVVDHGDYNHLITDAETLADFLNIPIWDGVNLRVRPVADENRIDLL